MEIIIKVSPNTNAETVLMMNQFTVITKDVSRAKIAYRELISCSAILMIGNNGYAGFHYAAQSLLCDKKDLYRADMNAMMADIHNAIQITKIISFTPIPSDSTMECFRGVAEDDKDILEQYFQNYQFFAASSLDEFLTECKNEEVTVTT